MVEEDNIGKLIKQKLKENGQSIAWLAKKVDCDHGNLCKILKTDNINSTLLKNISKTLKHDFFVYFSKNVKEFIENQS